MTLAEILAYKGSTVHTISPDATVADAVRTLVAKHIGSLVVCDRDGRVVGIITERDILRCVSRQTDLEATRVSERMSSYVVTVSPFDSLELAMGVMTERRIRHLPVIADGHMVGMISIGDLVKAEHETLLLENRLMTDYIRAY
ncbi:MAG: CBS domain-containing protein [Deltaproteobacteria bacterium]|nr:CBS domain-containing protein [Deltaproteobacteria bacterium]